MRGIGWALACALAACGPSYTIIQDVTPTGENTSYFRAQVKTIYVKTVYEWWKPTDPPASPTYDTQSDTFFPEALSVTIATLRARGYEVIVLNENGIELFVLDNDYNVVGLTPKGLEYAQRPNSAVLVVATSYKAWKQYTTYRYDTSTEVGHIDNADGETIARMYKPTTEKWTESNNKYKTYANASVFVGYPTAMCDRFAKIEEDDLAGVVRESLKCVPER